MRVLLKAEAARAADEERHESFKIRIPAAEVDIEEVDVQFPDRP